jgi:hypothetical protein
VTYDGAAWKESSGGDRFRRGMYTWFQRTSPYPALVTFDAPDANLACTRRERSNTPLQALTLLNDVTFVECAESLSKQMLEASDRGACIGFAFRGGLCREPTEREADVLRALYDDAARADVSEGSKESLSSAGCFAVARAIMNLDEFITRE